MKKLLSTVRRFLRRLYRRFRPLPLPTTIAAKHIRAGELVYFVGKRAYGVNPQELTKKRP